MRLSKRVGTAVVVVLSLAVAALAFYQCRRPDGTLPNAAARRVHVSEQAALSLEESLRRVMHLSHGQPFQLRATEEEVTSYLSINFPEAFLRDPQIRILEDALHATARMTRPIRTNVEIVCSLQVVDTRVRVDLRQATIGCFNLPRFLRASIDHHLNQALDTVPLNVSIAEVQLQDGVILILGHRST